MVTAIWVVQGIILVPILLRDLWHRDWMRIAGAAVGLAVAMPPISGVITGHTFYLHLFFAPVVLAVAYGLRRRWLAFILAMVFLGSLAYIPLIGKLLPGRGMPVPEIVG